MAPGHVPGAEQHAVQLAVPWHRFAALTYSLRAIFRAAGVAPGDTVIAYCHVGMQATAVVLGARLIGQPVRMYAGSFHDWSDHKLPTETGKP